MSKKFSTRIRRFGSASIIVLVAALSVGVWLLLSDASASDAAISVSPSDVSAVAAKLEALHQRTMSRTQAEVRDKDNLTSWGHAISPEQAAILALQAARARGDTTPSHSYIELQKRNGWTVYAVRIGAASVYIDADTGAVVT